ncbi:MAG: FAD-dependent oxidoreductase [Paracoccaceae bacterium]|nr:FAD-dependent oxidoreductase [Paracoccaceae bacterium]
MIAVPQNPEIIIIGAGTAGLSVAKSLRQAGVEVLVLEANRHVGGRCVTDKTTFSKPFDLGASWLHSAPINPLAHLAEKAGRPLYKTPWTGSRVHAMGRDLSPDEVQDYQAYHDKMWQAVNDAGSQILDTTPEAVLLPGPWRATANHMIAQMLAADADVTSAKDTYNYADAKGDWLVEGGLGAFVASLHDDVPVCLNCPVSKIDYAGRGVRVITPQGTLTADQCVITVSTGVLASGAIEFLPALPEPKRAALELLPLGLLNKVGIEFDRYWTKATEGQMADYQSSPNEFCSLLFGFYGSQISVGFVAGRFADALETQGVGAATEYCLEGLRANFGTNTTKYILRTDETAWRCNSYIAGSYSYAKPHGTEARRILADPLAERVFFAGEATMVDSYSTVHGAYLSGQRAAKQIISAKEIALTHPIVHK